CLVVLAATAVGVAALRRHRLGSAMLAVRANERSAAAAGINVVRTKLIAFGIAAFIAGIGGSLLAYEQVNVNYLSYEALGGLALFTTVYLAGITSVSGGILAGFLATGGLVYVLSNRYLSLGGWYAVLTGVGVIVTVIRNPEGLVGPIHATIERRRNNKTSSAPATSEVPPAAGDRSPPLTLVTN